MTMKMILINLALLCLYIKGTSGQCTYPSDLDGLFYSSHEGFLTWNSSSFGSLTITTITKTFSNLEFECHLNSGNYYVGRSSEFKIFTADFYAYICLELNRVSSNVYYYHYGTTELAGAGGSRVKILPITTSVTTTADVCNEPTPYPGGSFSILYKNGTEITGEASTCPSDIQGYYTYTLDDGSTTHCASDSYLDVCNDTTKLTFDYTRCNATNAMYSASGDLHCLYSQTSGSLNYVILYNNDVTVDDSSTYRTVCMLFEKGAGSTNYVTQFPKECANATSMNATAVISPGASLVLTLNDSCPVPSTTTTTTTSTTTVTPITEAQTAVATGSIVGGVMATLLVIAAIVLIIIGVMIYKKKKAGKVGKADDKENIIPNGHAETNSRTHFHPAVAHAGKEAASRTLFTPPNQVPSEDGDVLSDRHITLTQNSVDTLDEGLTDEYGEIQADEIMIVSEKTTMSMGAMTEASLPMYSNSPTPPPTGTNPTVVVEDIDAGTGNVNTARSDVTGLNTARSDATGLNTARSNATGLDTARSDVTVIDTARSQPKQGDTARSQPKDVNSPRSEKNSPRTEKKSPREEKKSPREEKKSPREEKKSPREEKKSPREEKKSPREDVKEVATPRSGPQEEGTPRTEAKEVETPRSGPKEVETPRSGQQEVGTPRSEAKKPPVKKPRSQKK